MNLHEAKKILSGKLVFGNESQIQAVRFMEKVNECCEAIENCEFYQEHKDDETMACEEAGMNEDEDYEEGEEFERKIKACDCSSGFDEDVLAGAIRKLTEVLYR